MKAIQAACCALAALALSVVATADTAPEKIVIPPRVERSRLPAFDAEAFPEEASKAPKAAEWKEAKEVKITRTPRRVKDCTFFRVREWVKMRCERKTAGARLLAGSAKGVELWVPDAIDDSGFTTLGRFVEIVFPVRKGDRRVFETFDFEFGEWEGFGTPSALLLEESWREGDKAPQIALLAR